MCRFVFAAVSALLLCGGCGREAGEGPAENAAETAARVNALTEKGEYAEGAQLAAEGLQSNASDKDLSSAAARLYFQWGWSLSNSEDKSVPREKYLAAMNHIGRRIKLGDGAEADYETAVNVHLALEGAGAAVFFAEQGLKQHPDSDDMKYLHARALRAAGRYSDALAAVLKLEESQPKVANVRWLHGYILRGLGRYEEAVAELDQAIALTETDKEGFTTQRDETRMMLDGPPTEAKFWAHYVEANGHDGAGRPDREAAERAKALEVLEAMEKSGEQLSVGNNEWYASKCHAAIGSGLELLGEWAQAYEHKRAAVRYMERRNDNYGLAHAMYGLAVTCSNYAYSLPEGDAKQADLRTEAIQTLKDMIAFCRQRRVGHVDRHAMAMLVSMLAEAGQKEEPEFRQYRSNMMPQPLPKNGPQGDCSIAQAVMTEARMAFEEGNYEEAAKLYEWSQSGAGNYSAVDNLRVRFNQYVNLVRCYREMGNPGKLTEYGEAVLATADAVRQRLNDDYTKRKLLGLEMQAAAAATANAYVDLDQPTNAFSVAERYKGRALLQLLKGKSLSAVESKEQEEQPRPEARTETVAEARRETRNTAQLLEGSTLRDLQVEPTAVKRLEEDTRVAKKAVASMGQDFALNLMELGPMAKDFTLVSYMFDNERGVALVLNDHEISAVALPELNQPKLTELLSQLRDAYSGPKAPARDLELEATGAAPAPTQVGPAAEMLYAMLIEPVLPHIRKPIVYFSTDGILNYLPFDMLQKNGRYLIQDFAIAYTPSASFLKWLLDKPAAGRESILALGNPNLKNPAFRLVNAGAEAQEVRALFAAGDALLEEGATESVVYARAPEVDILHFACHGEMNEDNPMLSSLRLAPDGAHDGYLHAGEVFDMHLKPSLVVLSACNSGVGEVSSGNELMGLTRSFFYAGAQAIVASLWFVDDRSTSELMQAFYRNLQTMNVAVALQQAKIEMMGKYADPIHWAPFALQGDYR